MNKVIQALRKRALRNPDTTEGAPPLARLEKWVDQSYRAVAGRKAK